MKVGDLVVPRKNYLPEACIIIGFGQLKSGATWAWVLLFSGRVNRYYVGALELL